MSAKARDAPKFHPLAQLFPLMTGPEFEDLKEDIGANGLADPITLYEKQVLDGCNRLRACQELGIKPRFADWSGPGSPLSFVIAKNLHRRHLAAGQRALLAARLVPAFEAEAKTNMSQGGQGLANLPTLHSRERAAAVAHVSPRLVGSGTMVLERGVPELVAAVERGVVKVSAAEQIAALDADAQEQLVEQGPAAVRGRANELRRAKAQVRQPKRRQGRKKAKPVRSSKDLTSDTQWLAGFPLRGRLANPRIFDCRALTWRRLKKIHEELRLAYPDVVASEHDRMVLIKPLPLWLGWMNPGPDPSAWVVCSICDGAGVHGRRRCWTCEGEGFRTQGFESLET